MHDKPGGLGVFFFFFSILPPDPLPSWTRGYSGKRPQPESVEKTVHLNTLEPALQVVDQVLKANRESTAEYREKAQEGCDNEVHTQVSTARAGRTKIQQLIRARYYWPAWRRDVERY